MKSLVARGRETLALCLIAASVLLCDASVPNRAHGQDESPPEGVDMLRPRGGILADFDPRFVLAAEADIPDEAWILGVVIDGEAHAYSLNLLNHHEVVNDRFGAIPAAAVW